MRTPGARRRVPSSRLRGIHFTTLAPPVALAGTEGACGGGRSDSPRDIDKRERATTAGPSLRDRSAPTRVDLHSTAAEMRTAADAAGHRNRRTTSSKRWPETATPRSKASRSGQRPIRRPESWIRTRRLRSRRLDDRDPCAHRSRCIVRAVHERWRAGRDSNPRPSGSKSHEAARSDASLRLESGEQRHRAAPSGMTDGTTAPDGTALTLRPLAG
jgi:hypothetical protein